MNSRRENRSLPIARLIMKRCDELARITDEPGGITRTFASPAMARANKLVASWMQSAGMRTKVDAIGNLIGHFGKDHPTRPILLLGSHLDTVRDAGRYDGPLGVILAIACVQHLHESGAELPFDIRVAAFSDEEGVRYHTTYLGSRAIAGKFDPRDLRRTDPNGISLADAIRQFGGEPGHISRCAIKPSRLLGYLESHIEQGPVLEKEDLAVGVVTTISGQSRFEIRFIGKANHAGTTPMNCRTDALCGAAEFIHKVERTALGKSGLVATVGCIQALPGASNVIPGEVILTLDVRHQSDAARVSASKLFKNLAHTIASRRMLKISFKLVQSTKSAPCSREFTKILDKAVHEKQSRVIQLPSGAGHDAAVLSQVTPVAMLFIRCKGGVSHHPDESVKTADVEVAYQVMNQFIMGIAKQYG